ncbi:hypothetical protein HAHE_32560 [Haloferula helveola]|uniref:NadR/Ttd14 AAA domain-containing protein n=1 Tax=Haloferula helveola TaxID=490095 RepID=A0ABM7RI32_9BACT|nr:hypothetical protein HAHE_32560 [Haloferula helveola]
MRRSSDIRAPKLVIVGAPGCGKLEILRSVAARFGEPPPEAVRVGFWETAKFDLEVDGLRFEVACLHGPQEYRASEELLLHRAIGVMCVMDVEPRCLQAAWDSLVVTSENARRNGFELRAIPFVLQYHRADRHPQFDAAKLDAWLGVPTHSVPRFVTPDSVPDANGGAFDALLASVRKRIEAA